MDALRLTIAEREAELLRRCDAYVGAVSRALDGRRATLVADAQDVQTAREAAEDAREVLDQQPAQLLSVTAAVARRLGELQARLAHEPLAPPPLDAHALRFELPEAAPERIVALVASLGAVLTPEDPVVEPPAADPETARAPGAPPVELVVHALRPKGKVGERVSKLLRLKHHANREGVPEGDVELRGGGGGVRGGVFSGRPESDVFPRRAARPAIGDGRRGRQAEAPAARAGRRLLRRGRTIKTRGRRRGRCLGREGGGRDDD